MSLLSALRNLLPTAFGPDEFDAALAATPHTLVLDVREPGEFAEGHIKGAVLVPMGKIPHHAQTIAESGVPVVVVCRSGARASSCESALKQAGTTDVKVLAGGVLAWQRAGRAVVTGSKSLSLSEAIRKAGTR
jgi:rhodanese-related sulfurtransferase